MSPSMVARRPMALEAPVRVTSRCVFPRTSNVPLKASSPSPLSTGSDSPVSTDSSSRAPRASARVPSAGISIPGFEAHPVARDQRMGREPDELPIAKDPCLSSGQRFQPRKRRFGPLFLIETEARIEQEDQRNRHGLNRPGLSASSDSHSPISKARAKSRM